MPSFLDTARLAGWLALSAAACSPAPGEAPRVLEPGGPAHDSGLGAAPVIPAFPVDAALPPLDAETAVDAAIDAAVDTTASCAQYASTFCSALSMRGADVLAHWYGTVTECETAQRDACKTFSAAPGSGWTTPRIDQCAASWPSATLDALVNPTTGACDTPAGARADGASCLFAAQCASGACHLIAQARCGVCGPRVAIAGGCTRTTDCQSGLVCTAGKCATPAPIGELGAPCASTDACGGVRNCKGTLAYNASFQAWSVLGGTCQAWTPSPAGGTCGLMLGAGSGTFPTFYFPTLEQRACVGATASCALPANAVQGTCVPRPAIGQTCTVEVGCAGVAHCVSGVCLAMDAAVCP